MKGLVQSIPTPPRALAAATYAAALAVLLCLASLACGPTAHAAGNALEITAPQTASAAAKIHYATVVSGHADRVAFSVDGRRRWVDSPAGRRFKRGGYLRTAGLGVGRHRLAIKVRRGNGKVARASRVLYVSAKGKGRGKLSAPTPPSTEEPAPAPAPAPPEEEPAPAPEEEPAPAPEAALLDAGFENGLIGWNIAGVGEVVPTVVGDVVRAGSQSGRVVLTGTQHRSELILGGNGGPRTTGMIEFHEGDEYWYGFSIYIESMVYGRPGAHNVIMQFKSDGTGSPNFDLSLWDYQGHKGLWSEGDAMGGNRFLAPFSEQAWHDIAIHFKASRTNAGFYEVYLDGSLVDARGGVSMIRPDRTYAYIKNGIYRNGDQIPGTSEIRIDAARLGRSATSVAAG